MWRRIEDRSINHYWVVYHGGFTSYCGLLKEAKELRTSKVGTIGIIGKITRCKVCVGGYAESEVL